MAAIRVKESFSFDSKDGQMRVFGAGQVLNDRDDIVKEAMKGRKHLFESAEDAAQRFSANQEIRAVDPTAPSDDPDPAERDDEDGEESAETPPPSGPVEDASAPPGGRRTRTRPQRRE